MTTGEAQLLTLILVVIILGGILTIIKLWGE